MTELILTNFLKINCLKRKLIGSEKMMNKNEEEFKENLTEQKNQKNKFSKNEKNLEIKKTENKTIFLSFFDKQIEDFIFFLNTEIGIP